MGNYNNMALNRDRQTVPNDPYDHYSMRPLPRQLVVTTTRAVPAKPREVFKYKSYNIYAFLVESSPSDKDDFENFFQVDGSCHYRMGRRT